MKPAERIVSGLFALAAAGGLLWWSGGGAGWLWLGAPFAASVLFCMVAAAMRPDVSRRK